MLHILIWKFPNFIQPFSLLDWEFCILTLIIDPVGVLVSTVRLFMLMYLAIGSTGGWKTAKGFSSEYQNWNQFKQDLLFANQVTSNIFVYSLEGTFSKGFFNNLVSLNWNESPSPEYKKAMLSDSVFISMLRAILRRILQDRL